MTTKEAREILGEDRVKEIEEKRKIVVESLGFLAAVIGILSWSAGIITFLMEPMGYQVSFKLFAINFVVFAILLFLIISLCEFLSIDNQIERKARVVKKKKDKICQSQELCEQLGLDVVVKEDGVPVRVDECLCETEDIKEEA